MKKPTIYLIKWLDAQSDDGWVFYNTRPKISSMIINSVGFIIDENKKYLKLALSWGKNKNGENIQFNGTMAIPKESILSKKKLK